MKQALVDRVQVGWALAAVVEGEPPQIVIDEEVQRSGGGDDMRYIEQQAQVERRDIARRRAALKALRLRHPAELVLAVPVAPRDTLQRLVAEVDRMVCLATPSPTTTCVSRSSRTMRCWRRWLRRRPHRDVMKESQC